MLHPVAPLLSLRKTRPLMLQRLCFLLAIWQHLYWKAQNCCTRVYTVPPYHTHSDKHTYTLRHAHSNLHTTAVQTSRLLFMCLLAEFEQYYECALTPNVISDIRCVSAVWRCLRVSFCFVRMAAADWQQTGRCRGPGSCCIKCFNWMEEIWTHGAACGIRQMWNNLGIR